MPSRALILVDIQYDFLPGGALAVPSGDEVVPVARSLQPAFDLIVATQDWHPPEHGSFAVNHPGKKPGDVVTLHGLEQVLWPVHCVEDTQGAALVKDLDHSAITRVFQKGTDPAVDSYSGFFDNGRRRSTGLGDYLKEAGVETIYLCGLATDYCVKFTALDGIALGFETLLVLDACRGVDLKPGDVDRAIQEMQDAGVRRVESGELGA